MKVIKLLALFFLSVTVLSCDEDATDDTTEEVIEEIDVTGKYEGTNTGSGVFSPSDNGCSKEFYSNTDDLEINVSQSDTTISAKYSLDISTSFGDFKEGNAEDCPAVFNTFSEVHTGDVLVNDDGTISFSLDIGETLGLDIDITYSFTGTIDSTTDKIEGTITHSSPAIVGGNIVYTIELDK